MAKLKQTSTSAEALVRPAEDVAGNTNPITDSAFQNLRQKIEGNLKKSDAKEPKKPVKGDKQKTNSTSNAAEGLRGKKRSRDGEVKPENGQPRQDQGKKHKHDAGSPKDDQEVDLKAIIAELGGTEEDLELIDGAQSDSELEGAESEPVRKAQPELKKGKSLEFGMANILKEIAMVKDTYQGSDSEEEPEEQDKTKAASKVNGITPSAKSQADQEDDSMKFKSAATAIKNDKEKGKKSRLRCQARPDWFNDEALAVDLELEPQFEVSTKSLEQLHAYAKSLLHNENEAFKSTQASSSSQSFYNTVIASGTLSDKISALTLAVQESPLHNVKAMEQLILLAKKRSRSQVVDVLRALKDLFAQGSLLPSDRKLHAFASQPALIASLAQVRSWQTGDHLPAGINESCLVIWAFEDWLKEQYFEMLKVLETWCNDEIEFAKSRATSYVYELLKEKPEQEANLLRLLINKLGDPVKKIASQASYLIMQLLGSHPAMKEIVVSAIDTDFIFKPGQSTHARYYAAVTLNQTALSVNEENVAIKLLRIYFGLFKLLLKPGEEHKKSAKTLPPAPHKRQREQAASMTNSEQDEELREKLISAVLTGVNRAYPYAGANHQSFDEHIDTLFQITHSANFNTSIQAMMLIQQLIANTSTPSDRFYRVLYESLLDPRLITSSKQQLYLNLLHRALKADLNQKRVKAFAKRILQILSLHEPSFVCGAFFLIQDLTKTFPSLATMLDQPEDHEEDEVEHFRDVDAEPTTTSPDTTTKAQTIYNPTKRDPSYSLAETSALWDILPSLAHYHPAVTTLADKVLDHTTVPGKPDLTLHTLIHFLDRFVYKNAKLSSISGKMKGTSIMQPLAAEDTRSVLVSGTGRPRMPVNSADFAAKRLENVAAEDVFFHQYFNSLGKKTDKKAAQKKQKVKDVEEGASDDEDEVWQAMLKNGPDLEALRDEDEDEFSDMEGFEEAMDEGGDGSGTDAEMDGAQAMDVDSDGSVDIEAGIFDDSDNEEELEGADVAGLEDEEEDDEASEFGGLSEDEIAKKAPSKKTVQRKEGRERKKKLKALPVFASAADWAKELDDDEDEDLG